MTSAATPLSKITPSTPLVLGSGSPRRREILTSLGVAFVVRAPDADEAVRPGETDDVYLPRVVLAKLAAVRASITTADRAAAVLVADTSVVLEGAILGKPADEADALAMITRLAGRTHEVHTRFAIGAAYTDEAPRHAETVATRVTFRAIDDDEARAYAATGEGMDKAGGYAVQGRASAFVSRIDGSYGAIVGLPACEVAVALRRLGLT
jgi:septum formation protein